MKTVLALFVLVTFTTQIFISQPKVPPVMIMEVNSPDSFVATFTKLIEAFNENDLMEFQTLFVEGQAKSDSNLSVFNFVVNDVIPYKGKIIGFHELSEPLRFGDSRFEMRSIIFHFEKSGAGSMTIALNDENKIDHLSLFVQSGICTNGNGCIKIKHSLSY